MTSRAWQGIRYLVVGGYNVLFTLAVFWVLDHFFASQLGVQGVYWISAVLGIINGFIWQRLFVWRSRNRWHLEFLRFLVMNLATSVVNSLLLLLTVQIGGLPAFPSQVVITGVLVIASYIVARTWVFRGGPEAVEPTPRRIDVFLQYYKPHVSGLTNMAADLADFGVTQGFEVHVHCVSLDGAPHESVVNGVTVHAYRRSFKVARGAFSIPLIRQMWRMRNGAGIAHAHMPYPEAFLLAWILGPGWKLIATYQCDAPMTGGASSLIARALDISQRSFIKRAEFTVCSSDDYLHHSRLEKAMSAHGGMAVPATSVDREGGSPVFAEAGKRYVGFLGRPTSEKGIDVALDALDALPADVCLLQAGPVAGLTEKASFDQAKYARLEAAGRIRALGFLTDEQIADFYASLAVFILPSTNSFEAFGIVQVEAMSAGTPVVASNLPGVRTVVQATGYGEVAAIGDGADLARCIMAVLDGDYDRRAARRVLEQIYLSPKPENQYLGLYERMLG